MDSTPNKNNQNQKNRNRKKRKAASGASLIFSKESYGSDSNKSSNSGKRSTLLSDESSSWNRTEFPYEVDYNDHFETPISAYHDIMPLLDAVSPNFVELIEHNDDGKYSKPDRDDDIDTRNTSSGNDWVKKSDDDDDNDNAVVANDNGFDVSLKRNRMNHILYDPYYCNGRTKKVLQSLGFHSTVHEKRDFYKDVEKGTVPNHHTLITNPPYSQDHKQRCVQFAMQNFGSSIDNNKDGMTTTTKEQTRPRAFFLLMPDYVATKSYFSSILLLLLSQQSKSKNELFESNHASIINGGVTILFVVPAHSYHYDHPEGTGKQQPPFNSIWFCGIPNDRLHIAKKAFENAHAKHNSKPMGDDHHHRSSDSSQNVTPPTPTLVSSVSELISMGILRAGVRPNPKRRKRGKNRLANTTTHAEAEFKSSNNTRKFTTMTQSQMERNSSSSSINNVNANTNDKDPKVYHPQGKNMKKSKHRNQNGVRTRKRF